MTNEQVLTDFMQKHYTDERLVRLLAWAEDGGLAYGTCCCFIGCATNDHAFLSEAQYRDRAVVSEHYRRAGYLEGADEAEDAFWGLSPSHDDAERRAKLIPLIKAEIERRDRERSESSVHSLQTVVV